METLLRSEGFLILQGNEASPVHALLGLEEQRKNEIEEAIFHLTSNRSRNDFDVLYEITEVIYKRHELAYAMFLWGTTKANPPAKENPSEDEGEDIDNPLID